MIYQKVCICLFFIHIHQWQFENVILFDYQPPLMFKYGPFLKQLFQFLLLNWKFLKKSKHYNHLRWYFFFFFGCSLTQVSWRNAKQPKAAFIWFIDKLKHSYSYKFKSTLTCTWTWLLWSACHKSEVEWFALFNI